MIINQTSGGGGKVEPAKIIIGEPVSQNTVPVTYATVLVGIPTKIE